MTNKKVKILIEGSGAIGIALGASMISQGQEVSFYAQKKTAEKLKEGISRVGIFKHLKFSKDKYNVYTSYRNIPNEIFDFVFICSKTISNKDIAKRLNENKYILKDNVKIIIFQNGFGNDEPYLKYFNSNQVYCARVITGFQRPERNISEVTVHTEPILIGSLQEGDIKEVEQIANLINNSGIPSETTNDIAKFLWSKMLYNCTLNPLGAILNLSYGELTENPYSIEIMDKLIDETFDVIKAGGYNTNWNSSQEYKEVFYSKLVPETYNHFSSTYQDIQKKKKTEIDSLNGKVIAIGEKYNVNVKVNKVIYNLIKTIESKF